MTDSGLIIPGQPQLRSRQVSLDLAAIEQRIRVARQSPDSASRMNAKNLLVSDAENLIGAVRSIHAELEGFRERHQELLQQATTAGVLLALILIQEPEWRWSKAFVEAYVPEGGWILETDPASAERWLLRMGTVAPTLSTDQQTEGSP